MTPQDATKQGYARNGGSESFTTAYLIVVNSLTETVYREVSRGRDGQVEHDNTHRRTEVYAAVWSMIRGALAASLLSAKQQEAVLNILGARLYSQWQASLRSKVDVAEPINARAAFYLQHVDPQDPITTATRIAEILLKATDAPATDRPIQTRLLAGLIAHRMVSDVWLFNDWESQNRLAPASDGAN